MSTSKFSSLVVLLLCCLTVPTLAYNGKWDLLQSNIGISAMHMQLLNTDKVVIFDSADSGHYSNISLPGGKCRNDPKDCTAHSVEYDIGSNSVRPLMVETDPWCSSGAVLPDGALLQTGGNYKGDHVVRVYKPCADGSCDWHEIPNGLTQKRWYATNHILPDGRGIIIGGRDECNYEFVPKTISSNTSYNLPFLAETKDPNVNNDYVENNLYPFVFLNEDGNLFIFANNRAILLNYDNGMVVRNYPEIPGGDPRSYPSTGSAVLLPLRSNAEAEVLVCGGAPKGAYVVAKNGTFIGALNTCGRMRINDPDPKWEMETMPMGRIMGDMVTLPNGNVLIINGCGSGAAGWGYGRDPVLSPLMYDPNRPIGSRFEVQTPSPRPRMYHSTAVLLRDGRVLVGGSNTNSNYNFTGVQFPTDLTLEAFSPSYLDSKFNYLRPKIVKPTPQSKLGYGQTIPIQFTIPPGGLRDSSVMVTMIAPSFSTHSFSMNQRLLVLDRQDLDTVGESTYQIRVNMPGSGNLAPSGYYLLFVVNGGIPSEGLWVQIK